MLAVTFNSIELCLSVLTCSL